MRATFAGVCICLLLGVVLTTAMDASSGFMLRGPDDPLPKDDAIVDRNAWRRRCHQHFGDFPSVYKECLKTYIERNGNVPFLFYTTWLEQVKVLERNGSGGAREERTAEPADLENETFDPWAHIASRPDYQPSAEEVERARQKQEAQVARLAAVERTHRLSVMAQDVDAFTETVKQLCKARGEDGGECDTQSNTPLTTGSRLNHWPQRMQELFKENECESGFECCCMMDALCTSYDPAARKCTAKIVRQREAWLRAGYKEAEHQEYLAMFCAKPENSVRAECK